jgi:hypothetical protein
MMFLTTTMVSSSDIQISFRYCLVLLSCVLTTFHFPPVEYDSADEVSNEPDLTGQICVGI